MLEPNTIINSLCLDAMRQMPDESIDCVITSPPYWNLRDYGYSEQWGQEKVYTEYLDRLISFMAECKRIIKPTGTIWINLGDSYNGSGHGYLSEIKGKQATNKGTLYMADKPPADTKSQGMPTKCLMLIPHRFAIRCVDELGLILRNDVVWAKPNAMPESVTDRFSKKHEFVFFFTKQQKYFFDLDAVRDKCTDQARLTRRLLNPNNKERMYKRGEDGTKAFGINPETAEKSRLKMIERGKNPGDVSDFWAITTKPSSAKHYATFNNELITKPIIAGCPEGGIVLDPFAGTGTTIATAIQLGRIGIGIEGNPEYCKIARERIEQVQGLFS